jgi:hypothetical protein
MPLTRTGENGEGDTNPLYYFLRCWKNVRYMKIENVITWITSAIACGIDIPRIRTGPLAVGMAWACSCPATSPADPAAALVIPRLSARSMIDGAGIT